MNEDYLFKKFLETGYKQNFIANKLGIKDRTLHNWLNMKGIEHSVKFIRLLYMCDLCPYEYLNNYYTTDVFKCKKCINCIKDTIKPQREEF